MNKYKLLNILNLCIVHFGYGERMERNDADTAMTEAWEFEGSVLYVSYSWDCALLMLCLYSAGYSS